MEGAGCFSRDHAEAGASRRLGGACLRRFARVHRARVVAIVSSALLLLAGCGGSGVAATADDAVKRWAEAINNRDWTQACELSVEPGDRCEESLRSNFDGDTLTFQGAATNGGGTRPGESDFSLQQAKGGGTVFVTAVPRDGGFVVRLEALVVD